MAGLDDAKEVFLAEFGVTKPSENNGLAKPYMNKAEMATWFKVAGVIEFMDEFVNVMQLQGRKKWAAVGKTIRTLLRKAFGERMYEIDPAQVLRIAGEWHKTKLILKTESVAVPVADDMANGDKMLTLPLDWYYVLVEWALEQQCKLCRMRGEQARMCKSRQMFLATDVPFACEEPGDGCPYQTL